MCGLVGMIAKKPSGFFSYDAAIFKEMLYADAVRGKDATGVFGVTRNGNLDWLKQASASGWFITNKDYDTFHNKIISNYHMVIGHNRKATHGAKRDKDAHPFIKDHIALVHNGMISNHKDFCKESTVDSNAIANALAEKPIDETIENVKGAFAFIWYDAKEKTLHFIRNAQRPLYIVETDTVWYLASESMLAGWCITRNNQKVTTHTLCEEHTLYSINLDKKEIESRKIEPKKAPITQVHYPTTSRLNYLNYGNAVDDDGLFLTAEIVKKSTLIWARLDMIVTVDVTDYDEYTPEQTTPVRVVGKILNTGLNGPDVSIYVPVTQMDDLIETGICQVKIHHIKHHDISENAQLMGTFDKVPAYVESLNGLYITNDMWLSLTFPSTCHQCKKSHTFQTLDEVNVDISSTLLMTDVTCTCSSCFSKENLCLTGS